MTPIYDLICTNEECKHVEANVVTTAEKINAGEEICPVCGKPLRIEFSTYKPNVIGAG